jgi:hypothetical protein
LTSIEMPLLEKSVFARSAEWRLIAWKPRIPMTRENQTLVPEQQAVR